MVIASINGRAEEVMHSYVRITHNLNPGDTVRVPGRKSTAKIIALDPIQHWPNCVILDKPLKGWKIWDALELEKVDEIPER